MIMQTAQRLKRIWLSGLVVLCATVASAQERTANYTASDEVQGTKIRPVIHLEGFRGTCNNYYNPWANYAPGYYNYPTHRDPHRGYVAYSHSSGSCLFGKCADKDDCDSCKANIARRVRCSLAWLRPVTYWDVGAQTDIIAVNPGYSHPNDMNAGYAAQGFGGPVTVPLAPNVRDAYNYSWGLPSSRLTPIGYPAPRW